MSTNEGFVSNPEQESLEELLTPEEYMGAIIGAIDKFQNGALDESAVYEVIVKGAQTSNKVASKIGKENLRILNEIHEGTAASKQATMLATRIDSLSSQKRIIDNNLATEKQHLEVMYSLQSNYLEELDDLSNEDTVELADISSAYLADKEKLVKAMRYIDSRRTMLKKRVLNLWSVATAEELPSPAARMTHNLELYEQELAINQEHAELSNKLIVIVKLAAQVKKMGDIGATHKRANAWAKPWLASDEEKALIGKLTRAVSDGTIQVCRQNIAELKAWNDYYEGTMRQLEEMKHKADAAVVAQKKTGTTQKRDAEFEDIKRKLELAIMQAREPHK